MDISLKSIAHILGGELRGDQVLAPGPGHSREDRSLSITISDSGDDVVVHSFAHDDPITCKDYVREKCGIQFKPNGKQRFSEDDIARVVIAAAQARAPKSKPIASFDYQDSDGVLLYQVLRFPPKNFRQRRPDGNGGYIWKLTDRRVVYRWPDLSRFPDATIFVTEGEKDAEHLWSIDLCATTVAAGKWTDDCVGALVGRDIIILQDNDDAGRTKALEAAKLLHGVANTVRVVLLPGLPDKGDVSDWLKTGGSKAQLLERAKAGPRSQPKGYIFVRASDIVPRRMDWLWQGHLLRGSQELLTGIPGTGKSQIHCALVAL